MKTRFYGKQDCLTMRNYVETFLCNIGTMECKRSLWKYYIKENKFLRWVL